MSQKRSTCPLCGKAIRVNPGVLADMVDVRNGTDHVKATETEKDYWKKRAEDAEDNARQIRFNSLPAYIIT